MLYGHVLCGTNKPFPKNQPSMRKLRKLLLAAASLIILLELFMLNYNDLSWATNQSNYTVILAMLFTAAAMVISNRAEQKRKNKKE